MADNLKELTTFEERLKHAEMKQLEKKITEFIRVLNCVVRIVQQWLERRRILVGLNIMKEVILRKAFRNWYTK